jgi:hypothetical protein
MTLVTGTRLDSDNGSNHMVRIRVLSVLALIAVGVAAVAAFAAWRAMGDHPSTYSDPQAMAAKLGCAQSYQHSQWADDPSMPIIGTCTRNGSVLTLATFPSNEAVQAYWIAARQFGPQRPDGTEAIVGVTGENWAVTSDKSFSDTVVQILQAS